MTITIFHNNHPYYQSDTFKNVHNAWTEYQGPNGKWLCLMFNMNSEEYKQFKGGETWIEIDKKTEIVISK